MTINVRHISTDENARIREVSVRPDGAILVSAQPFPPKIKDKRVIFRQFFTDDGLPDGSIDMLVDGSATEKEFWIPAHSTKDRYIISANWSIVDAGSDLNKFGNLASLANGCKLEYDTGEGRITIADPLKTNYEMLRMTNFNRPFGSGTSFGIMTNVVGTSEGFCPVLNFATDYLPPFGLKLDAGTTQKLIFTIRDNVSGLDKLDAYVTGFDLSE